MTFSKGGSGGKMNIYNSSISAATTPLIAVKGVCVVLTGVQADLCDRVAGGFNSAVGCQIDSGVFFHLKQKCKGGENCAHDVERQRAKTSISRGLFSIHLG